MLASARVVAFVPATDLSRARQFYESVLGLPVVHADGFAVVSSPAGVIRVTNVGAALRPQPFTVLGFEVDDIDATVDALVASGVEIARFPDMGQDERGVWRAPGGFRVAWFQDPDGNTLSVHQPTSGE